MYDQTYVNMMKRCQWNFAEFFFHLWEHPIEPIKDKPKRILLNLFQTATVCNKERLLFFVDYF